MHGNVWDSCDTRFDTREEPIIGAIRQKSEGWTTLYLRGGEAKNAKKNANDPVKPTSYYNDVIEKNKIQFFIKNGDHANIELRNTRGNVKNVPHVK